MIQATLFLAAPLLSAVAALIQGGSTPPGQASTGYSSLPPYMGASSTTIPLTTKLVTAGLSSPVAIAAPPGDFDRIFVVEQNTAQIRIVQQGNLVPTPFLSLASSIVAGGEQGLLGLAFHPNYASNGRFFVQYTAKPSGDVVVMAFKVSAANPNIANPLSGAKLLQVSHPFANHNGGNLKFGADGYLYIGIGDGGSANDPFNNAQNLSSLLGKILRIDVDSGTPYAIPPMNPFVGVPGARPEIWAYGLRNPWKFSFDGTLTDLYIADVGQDSYEEIDFQVGGSPGGLNYGWRCFEGNHSTGLSGCLGSTAVEKPILEYPHGTMGCAVIGGCVYRGFAIPDLRGTYFFADWCTSKIWSFQYQGGVIANYQERTAELVPNDGVSSINSISAFGEDAAGELYIVDYTGGELFKVIPNASVPLFGVTYFGTGTPGCTGVNHLTATQSPIIGNPFFGLQCDNAPVNNVGFLFITDVINYSGSDTLGLGVVSYLDFIQSTQILAFYMPSGPNGTAAISIPVPNSPYLAGSQFSAQVFWYWAGQCAPPPADISSSTAVELTLVP